MKLIHLTRGFSSSVDEEDFEELSKYNWQAVEGQKTFYARRGGSIYMHRQILGEQNIGSKEIDHLDGNGLNNQRNNLRIVNKYNQQAHVTPHKDGISKFKGVDWACDKCRWRARIMYRGKASHLGYFDDEFSASIHYDMAALALFGDYAYLNHAGLKNEYLEQIASEGYTQKEDGRWIDQSN